MRSLAARTSLRRPALAPSTRTPRRSPTMHYRLSEADYKTLGPELVVARARAIQAGTGFSFTAWGPELAKRVTVTPNPAQVTAMQRWRDGEPAARQAAFDHRHIARQAG